MCVFLRRVIWYTGIYIYTSCSLVYRQSSVNVRRTFLPFLKTVIFRITVFIILLYIIFILHYYIYYYYYYYYYATVCRAVFPAPPGTIHTRTTATISSWTAHDGPRCSYACTAHNANRHWTFAHGLVRIVINIMSITL